jgi:hypothetical protein
LDRFRDPHTSLVDQQAKQLGSTQTQAATRYKVKVNHFTRGDNRVGIRAVHTDCIESCNLCHVPTVKNTLKAIK